MDRGHRRALLPWSPASALVVSAKALGGERSSQLLIHSANTHRTPAESLALREPGRLETTHLGPCALTLVPPEAPERAVRKDSTPLPPAPPGGAPPDTPPPGIQAPGFSPGGDGEGENAKH